MAYEKPAGYNEVQDRIIEFREKYPNGSLQRVGEVEWVREGDKIIGVTYTAAAYRTPDDTRPGIGTAYEVFPGKTPYTKGSEVMNAETSAWGRALIAVGAADAKKGIASANEVRSAKASNGGSSRKPAGAVDERRQEVVDLLKERKVEPGAVTAFIGMEFDARGLSDLSVGQLDQVEKWVREEFK